MDLSEIAADIVVEVVARIDIMVYVFLEFCGTKITVIGTYIYSYSFYCDLIKFLEYGNERAVLRVSC